ncbi:unnamed protein product [Closterium sp. NIES-54]
MGSSHMYHGGASNLHDQANAVLNDPILLWRGRKCERLADALLTTKVLKEIGGKLTSMVRVQMEYAEVLTEPCAQLAENSADLRDQNNTDVSLLVQGKDRGVARICIDDQQELALPVRPRDGGGEPHDPTVEAASHSVTLPTTNLSRAARASAVLAATSVSTSLGNPLTKLLRRESLLLTLLLLLPTPRTSASTSCTARCSSSCGRTRASTPASSTPTTARAPSTIPTTSATFTATATATSTTPTTTTTTTATTPATATASAPSTTPTAPIPSTCTFATAAPPTRGRRSTDLLSSKEVNSRR